MKLMVIGYARHGKDTVCNYLRDTYGFSFVSSSYFVARKAVIPYLAAKGIVYSSFDDAYADRVNHRAEWFDAIYAYNKDDPARLGRELFQEYDIYCGNRNIIEFTALKLEKAFDFAWWVDRGLFEKPEDKSSNTLTPDLADYIINNNGNLENLYRNVDTVYRLSKQRFLYRQRVTG